MIQLTVREAKNEMPNMATSPNLQERKEVTMIPISARASRMNKFTKLFVSTPRSNGWKKAAAVTKQKIRAVKQIYFEVRLLFDFSSSRNQESLSDAVFELTSIWTRLTSPCFYSTITRAIGSIQFSMSMLLSWSS